MWALFPHLKQKFNLIYCFHLKDPNKAYFKFLMSISIILKYLGCNGDLIGNCKIIVFCQETGFSAKHNILLYYLLIMFVQALNFFNKFMPIKEVFSLRFKILIKLLFNVEFF